MTDRTGATALFYANADDKPLIQEAMAIWEKGTLDSTQSLTKKFMVTRRLRQGTTTTEGHLLELPQRQLAEGIIRKAEYDNLCKGLQSNLNKPGVVALARSLQISTSNRTKTQLCEEIAGKLII
jgi:hypothetical protein